MLISLKLLILPYKNHASRWIRDLWSKGILLILAYLSMFLSFWVLNDFFRFSKFVGFRLFLVHPTHGGNHASRWIRDLWLKGISLILAYLETFLSFCVLDDFFRFSKKLDFRQFLVHPIVVLVLLSASVERCFVSRMRDF